MYSRWVQAAVEIGARRTAQYQRAGLQGWSTSWSRTRWGAG